MELTDVIKQMSLEMLHWIFSLSNIAKHSSVEAFVETKPFLFLTAYAEFLEQKIPNNGEIKDEELRGLMKVLKKSSRALYHSSPGASSFDMENFRDAVSSFAVAYENVHDYLEEHP